MKFEVYKDSKGEHRWRLKQANGAVLATSSEAYSSKASAMKVLESVKYASSSANTTLQKIVSHQK